ncbi:hypothetical protein ACCO45_004319 [Purpureocillium lilacinum]|uniref:Uncharacterized protein n=1 Tax=Purpureocillium lilacinum TaxID=33203 RepID=A0ACC4E2V1_PURLI
MENSTHGRQILGHELVEASATDRRHLGGAGHAPYLLKAAGLSLISWLPSRLIAARVRRVRPCDCDSGSWGSLQELLPACRMTPSADTIEQATLPRPPPRISPAREPPARNPLGFLLQIGARRVRREWLLRQREGMESNEKPLAVADAGTGPHGFCLDYTIENEAPSPSATFKGSGYIRATLEPDDYHAFVYDPLLKSDAAQEMRGSQWNLG